MTPPSWQARVMAALVRVLVRREDWGTERALARRARWLFGAPGAYGRLRARGLRIEASTHPEIVGEWLRPSSPTDKVILYIHGGGFVSCSAATHRPITSQLARMSRTPVFAVNYRLAPEHRYPAGLDDVMAAYRWLVEQCGDAQHLAVAGDSAGGNLTLGLLLRARDEGLPLPACAAALSPWMDLTGGSPSVEGNNGQCPIFRPRNMPDFARAYLGDAAPSSRYASPLSCDLSGLPPVLLQVGSVELLLDDALRTHDRIRASRGESLLRVYNGMFHGWQMLDGIVPEARLALQEVAEFLGGHLNPAGHIEPPSTRSSPMPEYLTPDVYIEEMNLPRRVDGVGTSTAGFVGPARTGPVGGAPVLVTSFTDFEQIFGGLEPLQFGATPVTNFLAHGVRAFFDNGGRRAYVARILRADPQAARGSVVLASQAAAPALDLVVAARFPGRTAPAGFGMRFRVGGNVLHAELLDPSDAASPLIPALRGVAQWDLVFVETSAGTSGSGLYWVDLVVDPATSRPSWVLTGEFGAQIDLRHQSPGPTPMTRVLPVSCLVEAIWYHDDGSEARRETWDHVAFHHRHPRSLSALFGPGAPITLPFPFPFTFDARESPRGPASPIQNGPAVARMLLDQVDRDFDPLSPPGSPTLLPHFSLRVPDANHCSFVRALGGGDDGDLPRAEDYEGTDDPDPANRTGLEALADVWDISIVAAPGYSYHGNTKSEIELTARALIAHCERMRYRVTVLDAIDQHGLAEVRAHRALFDSTRAALYYPWVRAIDPITSLEIDLPPSGFLAGIYARTDMERGVHQAPANEVVRGAVGLETLVTSAQQDVLNPEGINVLRYFPGRGYRVWGARTMSSDPEWKYVNLRRYFVFLEQSIERGIGWVVFEPNAEPLWAAVRQVAENFLLTEWRSGHLAGSKPEEAYFVRCDRTTMTQSDLDTGRLVCLIGVAPTRPAEFVIFRIGQWTVEHED